MEHEQKILEAQLKRIITQLFKNCLTIVEDIRQDHLAVIVSLEKQFPEQMVRQWNYLDLGQYSRVRKKVLDSGNDAIREMQTVINDFDIQFKNTN